MPELPEVEVCARNLRRWSIGRTLTSIDSRGLAGSAARLTRPDPPASLDGLRGARVLEVGRVGKNILVRLSGRPRQGALGLWLHLGMTGRVLRRRTDEPPFPYERVALQLDDGSSLGYCDTRLFGRVRLAPRADFAAAVPGLDALGPDPLAGGIDRAAFAARLARTTRPIHVALLDQSVLAGVGNIQSSEACFRAAVDPRRPARELDRAEVDRLAEGIASSIEDTIAGIHCDPDTGRFDYVNEGGDNPFRAYDREGERCPRCRRADIQRLTQGGRSTFFCPRCQR